MKSRGCRRRNPFAICSKFLSRMFTALPALAKRPPTRRFLLPFRGRNYILTVPVLLYDPVKLIEF